MQNFESVLRQYDYVLPEGRIAQAPASPRDSSNLLIHDRKTGKTSFSTFRKLADFLPRGAVIVFNRTKVIPAKLLFTRVTSGKVSALFLRTESGKLKVWANRRLNIGETLTLSKKLTCTVLGQSGREWILQPNFPLSTFHSILHRHGNMPLPPYIKHTPLSPAEQRKAYQAIFAKVPGSIAAPTASLHFTPRLLASLKKKGIIIADVTLHVHLGTFAPLTEEQWKKGELHSEEYEIPKKTVEILARAKREKRKVIAVGTTVMRTLESSADAKGMIKKPKGVTNIFIREGYKFRLTEGLITNFHVPKSSLLMLVAAFAGRENILEQYQKAIDREFRFFSFGDGMVIL